MYFIVYVSHKLTKGCLRSINTNLKRFYTNTSNQNTT